MNNKTPVETPEDEYTTGMDIADSIGLIALCVLIVLALSI